MVPLVAAAQPWDLCDLSRLNCRFQVQGTVPCKLDFDGKTSFAGFGFVGLKRECTIADIGASMEAAFSKLKAGFAESQLKPAGNPFAIYHKWNLVKGMTEYTLGFPIDHVPTSLPSEFVSGTIPACDVYSIRHTGPYRHLGNAWASGMMHARAKAFAQSKSINPFETYENDPESVAENELITTVQFPMK